MAANLSELSFTAKTIITFFRRHTELFAFPVRRRRLAWRHESDNAAARPLYVTLRHFLFRLIVVSRIPDYRIGIILVHFVLIVIINIVEFEIFLIVAFRLNFHGKTSL